MADDERRGRVIGDDSHTRPPTYLALPFRSSPVTPVLGRPKRLIGLQRVLRGRIDFVNGPRSAAMYGLMNFSWNSAIFSARSAAGSAALSIASSGPMTAMSRGLAGSRGRTAYRVPRRETAARRSPLPGEEIGGADSWLRPAGLLSGLGPLAQLLRSSEHFPVRSDRIPCYPVQNSLFGRAGNSGSSG